MRIYDSAGLVKISASNIPIAANPSGLIGLAAVNGSATTFTRSDSTHALDQGIAPTWTAAHIFSAATGTAVTVNATSGNPGVTIVGAAGAGTSFGQFIQAGANGSDYALRANTKAGLNLLNLAGDGTITFGNTTSNAAFNFNGTGTTTFGGPIATLQSSTGYVSHNLRNSNAGVGAGVQIELLNDATAALALGIASSNSTGAVWTNGPNYAGFVGTTGSVPLSVATNNTERLRISSTGAITINPPASGSVPLQINGVANQNALQIAGVATSGQSYGMDILAGTSSGDWPLNIRSAAAVNLFQVNGLGNVRVGPPTSGRAVQFNGPTGNWTIAGAASTTTSSSFGLILTAGTNSADTCAIFQNATGATTYLGVYGNGAVQFPAVTTTATAANAFLDVSNANNLLRSTSSIKYKDNIRDVKLAASNNVLNLRPVKFRSKAEADRKDFTHYGLIAEEVAQIDPRLIHWGLNDAKTALIPDGVQYDRIVVLLLGVVKRQQAKIDALEKHCYPNLDFAA